MVKYIDKHWLCEFLENKGSSQNVIFKVTHIEIKYKPHDENVFMITFHNYLFSKIYFSSVLYFHFLSTISSALEKD